MKKIYLKTAGEQIARHKTIRDINTQVVLNYVRARSPISRADIARETSLQRSTVSSIVDGLQADGLIEEIGTGDSTGGRKPTLLQLRTGTPCAIGIDVTPTLTTIVVADLGGNILEQDAFPTSSDLGYMDSQIVGKVAVLSKRYAAHELEIGMSVPGIADQSTGEILYVPYFHWSNWDITRQVAKATGRRVTVDNDANAVALAELWFGNLQIRSTRNFIFVMVAEGIGTGIVIDGQVYRGEFGAAGEFGHMHVAEDAPVTCSCGRRDCWEAQASEKAFLGRYRANGAPPNSQSMGIGQLIDLAVNGEPRAARILTETATYLGIGISNLIVGFSPQAVVIGGTIAKAWDLIHGEIDIYAKRSIREGLSGTLILPSALGSTPTILGSVSLVLAKKFASAK